MNKEELINDLKEMFSCVNSNRSIKIAKKLRDNNIVVKDLNTRIVVWNKDEKFYIPTIGKGMSRKYLFNKIK